MKLVMVFIALFLFIGTPLCSMSLQKKDSTQRVEKAKADTVLIRAQEHVVIDSLRSKLTLWEDAWENMDAVVAATILILGVGIGMVVKSLAKM